MGRHLTICTCLFFCQWIATGQTGWQKYNYGTMRSEEMKAYTFYQLATTKKDKKARFQELIAVAKYQGNDYLLIKGFTQQAGWYRLLGDYANARALLDSALLYTAKGDINRDVVKFSRDGTSVYEVYEEKGRLYLELGNLPEARRWFELSIQVKKEKLKKGDLAQVTPYLGLARIKNMQGDLQSAIEAYEDVLIRLSQVTSTMKTPYVIYAQTYIALARLSFDTKAYDQSLKYAKTGLRIVNDPTNKLFLLDDKVRLKTELLNLMAKNYLSQGDLKQAIKFFEKAKTSFFEAYSREDNYYTQLIVTDIELAKIQGQDDRTLALLEELMDNHLRYIDANFAFLSEKEKEDFYDRVNDDVKYYYQNQYTIFKESRDLESLTRILNRQLTTKAFILSDINRTKRSILESGNEKLIEALESYQDVKSRIATLTYNDPSGNSIDSLKVVLNNKEQYLSQASGLLNKKSRQVSWKEVQNSLEADEVAVECIRITLAAQPFYLMLLIHPDRPYPDYVVIENGVHLENKAIKAYRANIAFKMEDSQSFDHFWKPIADKISPNNTVYFSPDGVYHQLSIATLYDQRTGQFVLENTRILNVTNTRDLIESKKENSSSDVVLFGRPDYDFEDHSFSDVMLESDALSVRSNMSMSIDKFFDQNFSDLPGTSEEILAITKSLAADQWTTTSFLGSAANEEQIKSVDNPGILHVATHGFFLGGSKHVNPMMRSGLVLAGVKNQKADRQEDGVLTAYEATALKLNNTNLVVLSACETALGDVKEGEGVYGLQRALIVAGAQKLVMSMWKVNDEATRDLMIAFYSRISDGVAIDLAFRQAQLEVKGKYQHPYYWGAFVLITS